VTPENQTAPWLNFESGALAKTVDKTLVCTYLVGLSRVDVTGLLKKFQATDSTGREETHKLIGTLNRALGAQALSEVRLTEVFDRLRPDLEKNIESIASEVPSASAKMLHPVADDPDDAPKDLVD
jgi:hypothetical protein